MMFFILISVVLLLVYLSSKSKYLRSHQSFPGLPARWFFGNLIESGILFGGKSLAEVLIELKERFGDHFEFWLGPSRFIIVSDIDDVQQILSNRNIYEQGDVFIEKISLLFPGGLGCIKGEQFRRHMMVTASMFRRSNIVSNLELIVRCADQLVEHWRRQATSNLTPIQNDIVQQSKNLLLDIFGFLAFDYDLQMLKQNRKQTENELTLALQQILSSYSIVIYFPRWLSRIYLKINRRYRRSRALIRNYFNRMIDQELEQTEEFQSQRQRICLLSSLVSSMKKDEKRKILTREEILNEMLLFLVAGYESTSSALAWFIHLMSKNPDVQKKIKTELSDRTDLNLEQIDSMIYLDCVIKEVLRFCPPAVGTARTLTCDDRLQKSSVELKRSDSIFIPFHNLAQDKRYWVHDPSIFYPERFLEKDRNHRPTALIPFGGGHRQCVAKDLAFFELKVIAARFMQRLTFVDGGSPLNDGGHFSRITIMPKHCAVFIKFDSFP